MGEYIEMGFVEDCSKINWPFVLRIASICCAIGLIIIGVLNFSSKLSKDFPSGIIISVYLMFFALLIVMAEFRLKVALELFDFLSFYHGRGMFYIFVGTMCLLDGETLNVVMAIVTISNGFCQIFMKLCTSEEYLREKDKLDDKKFAEKSNAAVSGTAKAMTKREIKALKKAKKEQEASQSTGEASGAWPPPENQSAATHQSA